MREHPRHHWEDQLSFRSIIAEPAELQKLADAFDAAWISVNAAKLIEPLQNSAERERLGFILVHLWQSEPNVDLVTVAVERFSAGAAKSDAGRGVSPLSAVGQHPFRKLTILLIPM